MADSFDWSIANWVRTVSNRFSRLDSITQRVRSKFHEGSGVSWWTNTLYWASSELGSLKTKEVPSFCSSINIKFSLCQGCPSSSWNGTCSPTYKLPWVRTCPYDKGTCWTSPFKNKYFIYWVQAQTWAWSAVFEQIPFELRPPWQVPQMVPICTLNYATDLTVSLSWLSLISQKIKWCINCLWADPLKTKTILTGSLNSPHLHLKLSWRHSGCLYQVVPNISQ